MSAPPQAVVDLWIAKIKESETGTGLPDPSNVVCQPVALYFCTDAPAGFGWATIEASAGVSAQMINRKAAAYPKDPTQQAVSSPGKQDKALKLMQDELDDLRSQLKEARSPARPSGLPGMNAEAEPFRPDAQRPGPQLSALCDFAQAAQPSGRISHTAARMDQEQASRLDGLPPRTAAFTEAARSGTKVPQSSASGVRSRYSLGVWAAAGGSSRS